jgi:hypothetical protein
LLLVHNAMQRGWLSSRGRWWQQQQQPSSNSGGGSSSSSSRQLLLGYAVGQVQHWQLRRQQHQQHSKTTTTMHWQTLQSVQGGCWQVARACMRLGLREH